MVRIAFWAALATGAAVAIGCGEIKDLPDDIPVREAPKEVEPPVPKVSEAGAKEFVAKAVSALTGGKPDLVQRARTSRAVFKGRMHLPGDSGLVPYTAKRTAAAVWPDRVQITDELTLEKQTERVQVFLHRPRITAIHGQTRKVLPEESERVVTCDATAQYWLALGLPLIEPTAIAFDLQPASASGPTRLRLALPKCPTFALTFDAKTNLLMRVEYSTVEQGRTRRKEWTLTATQADAKGVHLPHKFEFRQDSVLVEEWTAEKWEFPESIPDSEFVPPPEKK